MNSSNIQSDDINALQAESSDFDTSDDESEGRGWAFEGPRYHSFAASRPSKNDTSLVEILQGESDISADECEEGFDDSDSNDSYNSDLSVLDSSDGEDLNSSFSKKPLAPLPEELPGGLSRVAAGASPEKTITGQAGSVILPDSAPPAQASASHAHPSLSSAWFRVYPDEPVLDIAGLFSLRRSSGPRCPQSESAMDYFNLFFHSAVWDLFVRETNSYAQRVIASKIADGSLSHNSRLRQWVDVTVDEMKKFIALSLSFGLTERKHLTQYWSRRPNLYMPFFSSTMSLKRFQLILAMFHVSPPRNHPSYDPFVKLRDFMTMMNYSFKQYFVPHQEVCIDESIVGMKNRCSFIKFMPHKRNARSGVKKFELCDSSSGYILQSVLYTSKDFLSGSPNPFTHKVVELLFREVGLLKKGCHLFTNNFYSKIPLARWLLSQKTLLTSKLNKRPNELSKTVLESKLAVGQSVYFRKSLQPSGSVLLVKYKERELKKPVYIVTTACHAKDCEVVSKSGQNKVKPLLIQKYNKFIDGVVKDKSIYHVACKRTTSKCWQKIVYNFIDMALFNAYILYLHHNVNPKSRFDFTCNIIDGLVPLNAPVVASPAAGPNVDELCQIEIVEGHVLEKLGDHKERNCVVCAENNLGRKRSRWQCTGCDAGVHESCFPHLQHYPRQPKRGRRH